MPIPEDTLTPVLPFSKEPAPVEPLPPLEFELRYYRGEQFTRRPYQHYFPQSPKRNF